MDDWYQRALEHWVFAQSHANSWLASWTYLWRTSSFARWLTGDKLHSVTGDFHSSKRIEYQLTTTDGVARCGGRCSFYATVVLTCRRRGRFIAIPTNYSADQSQAFSSSLEKPQAPTISIHRGSYKWNTSMNMIVESSTRAKAKGIRNVRGAWKTDWKGRDSNPRLVRDRDLNTAE
jgi:hypothetical protein